MPTSSHSGLASSHASVTAASMSERHLSDALDEVRHSLKSSSLRTGG